MISIHKTPFLTGAEDTVKYLLLLFFKENKS